MGGLLDVGIEEEVEDDVGFVADGVQALDVEHAFVAGPPGVHGPVCTDGEGCDAGKHCGERVGVEDLTLG